MKCERETVCGVTLVDKRLLLVDGHSLANRAFYALPPLTASDGTPTGAVFGFLSMLLRFLSEKRPSHVAIAFDLPGPTFRHVQYAEYKAQRKPSPPEFSAQIPVLKEVLDVLRLLSRRNGRIRGGRHHRYACLKVEAVRGFGDDTLG